MAIIVGTITPQAESVRCFFMSNKYTFLKYAPKKKQPNLT